MNASVQKTMKTFYWLVRREFWENKAIFLWLPVALGVGFFLLFIMVEIFFKGVLSANQFKEMQSMFDTEFATNVRSRMVTHVPVEMARFFLHVLLGTGAFLSSFYLLSALHGDRRDRSILFWKSMPISDFSQVGVKLVFPLIFTPLLAIGIGFLSYFLAAFTVGALSIFSYFNFFGTILSNRDLYDLPLTYLSLLPFYFVWALPTVGWFLLVSSIAKSRVFPWAVGMPILTTLILAFVNSLLKLNLDMVWIVKSLLARLIAANLPASWLLDLSPSGMEAAALQPVHVSVTMVSWSSPSLWLGAISGVVMITLAARCRRFADSVN